MLTALAAKKILLGTKALLDFFFFPIFLFFFSPAIETNLRQKAQRELLAHTKQPSDRNPAGSSASSLMGRSLESTESW